MLPIATIGNFQVNDATGVINASQFSHYQEIQIIVLRKLILPESTHKDLQSKLQTAKADFKWALWENAAGLGTDFVYFSDFKPEESIGTKGTATISDLKLYPNPTNDLLIIEEKDIENIIGAEQK